MMNLQHFILTRFNLLLWNKDKEGHKVRTVKWLEHRFSLFEQYCFPSVKEQTSKNFTWIVLFDNTTPEKFKTKIAQYKKGCPQFVPVYVEPKNGCFFAEIFRAEVVKRLTADRVLTTYLDNDDAINVQFVEDLQQRVSSLSDGTFVYYSDGYQFYKDKKYLMRIRYKRNHFASVVERGEPSAVKTIYGYGSHYYINQIEGVRIEYVLDKPLWCEVIHEKNMGNDAYFLGAKMVRDSKKLRSDFAINETAKYGMGLYSFQFLPRYGKTFIRRCRYRLFGRHW